MKNYLIFIENSVKSPTIYITHITTSSIRGKMNFAIAIQVILKLDIPTITVNKDFLLIRDNCATQY